jgi:hypothetical protein
MVLLTSCSSTMSVKLMQCSGCMYCVSAHRSTSVTAVEGVGECRPVSCRQSVGTAGSYGSAEPCLRLLLVGTFFVRWLPAATIWLAASSNDCVGAPCHTSSYQIVMQEPNHVACLDATVNQIWFSGEQRACCAHLVAGFGFYDMMDGCFLRVSVPCLLRDAGAAWWWRNAPDAGQMCARHLMRSVDNVP